MYKSRQEDLRQKFGSDSKILKILDFVFLNHTFDGNSWNWVILCDFASFKPTFLPEDNPADFSYFFDTSRRRTCYLAPERFKTRTIEMPPDGFPADNPQVIQVSISSTFYSSLLPQYFFAKKSKSQMRKAARSTFVWKICVLNVDEINYRSDQTNWAQLFWTIKINTLNCFRKWSFHLLIC